MITTEDMVKSLEKYKEIIEVGRWTINLHIDCLIKEIDEIIKERSAT